MRIRKYFVTGGTGFIGSALVRRLVALGHHVCVVDNDLRGSAARLADVRRDVRLVDCDVRDVEAMTTAAAGSEIIVHLAALNGTENFYNRPELVLDVGIRGMYAALETARRNDIEQFVLASSSEVYQTPPVVPTPEIVPLTIPEPWNPRYSYAGSKLISEIMLANYNFDLFKKSIIFRPHNVYGPDMGWEHVIPQFVLRAKDQTERYPQGSVPFEIQGDGTQTRSFVHIEDFLDGLMLAIEKGAHRNIYHIGMREEITINELVEFIFQWLGRKYSIEHTVAPAGGTQRRCPDISKLEALGFNPRISIREGISEIAEWYWQNAHLKPV